MSFNRVFFQMQTEGFITRSCICTAFNELLAASVSEKGRYYVAFFQIAIGIERIAKLAIILDHMIKNDLSPLGPKGAKKLQTDWRHGLLRLYDNAESISQSRPITQSISFKAKLLHRRMLAFLSDFANGGRYENLDSLAAGRSPKEPFKEWNAILWEVFKTDLPEERRKTILQDADGLTSSLQGRATVMAHDLDNNPLSVGSMILLELIMKAIGPYVVWNLVVLLLPITELVSHLADEARRISISKGNQAMTIPHIDEFYEFLSPDQAYVLSRTSW
ncbi:MAG: hypothetical protein ACLP53_20650 [Isosphaeraceae bacterium]